MPAGSSLPALIPAAGRGTRLRPITSYFSKSMLPLGAQPAIQKVIEEAIRAECRPVVIIVAPGDQSLKKYLTDNYSQQVIQVEQPRPLGLADALVRGYDCLKGEQGPVALLLPDNIVLEPGGMEEIVKNRRDNWLTFGTVEVDEEEAKYFGDSGGYAGERIETSNGRLEVIKTLQEKRAGQFNRERDSWPARRTVGRALLPPEFFSEARRLKPDPETNEKDDVPVYRRLLARRSATGVLLSEKVYDMGQPERYLRLCAAEFQNRKSG